MIVRGYAAVFGNIDRQNEVVEPGAFTAWLEQGIRQVPLLWLHDAELLPIGHTTYLVQDDYGLRYEALIVDTAHGNDIAKLIGAGSLTASSFAYRTLDEYLDLDGVNHLVELELIEVSVVTWGANPEATVTAEPAIEIKDQTDPQGGALLELVI
jgi:HK97 family phage prohead protease